MYTLDIYDLYYLQNLSLSNNDQVHLRLYVVTVNPSYGQK